MLSFAMTSIFQRQIRGNILKHLHLEKDLEIRSISNSSLFNDALGPHGLFSIKGTSTPRL